MAGAGTAVRRFLAARTGGAIVNVSSHQARRAVPGALPYATAKAALEGLTRALAVDNGPRGIRANAVALGSVHTERHAAYLAGLDPVEAAHVDADTARSMSPDEHRRAFLTFVAGMLDNLDRYLDSSPEPDLARDGAGYALSALHLDEAELEEFLGELRAVIEPRRANGPREGRRRRIFSTVVMPEVPKS